jgi:DNA-directed RNA polymerase
MPAHLNHISSDLCRGMMRFATQKKLGEKGWFWLQVHLASLYGYDKQSFSDREKWVMDNLTNIFDSVDYPLSGKRWWASADDPWQCLATCYEIAAAVRSGSPMDFESSLPVHQDGTCNGLQHYAALGGDIDGAQQVNLVSGDRPADVYTAVATAVTELVKRDAEKGNELAKVREGKITRKLVKQTVMTNVYGVTFVGARQQIANRLKEQKKYSEDKIYCMANYLAKKVFLSLGKIHLMIDELKARLVMKYLICIPKKTHIPFEQFQSYNWYRNVMNMHCEHYFDIVATILCVPGVRWGWYLNLGEV